MEKGLDIYGIRAVIEAIKSGDKTIDKIFIQIGLTGGLINELEALIRKNKLKKRSYLKKKVMSFYQIKRFIMFYQRITLQMVKDLSKSASVVMFLKKNHEIKKALFRS